MVGLAGWPARQPAVALLILVLLALSGAALSPRLPLERVQTEPGNTLKVRTRVPGFDALQIEQRVTRPLEQVFASLPGLQDMIGRSGDGVATIELRFPTARVRERALVDATALAALAAPQLPVGLDTPTIERVDPAVRPAIIYAIVAKPLSTEVAAWAEHHLQRPLRELRNTAAVDLDGVETREVSIQPDLRRLVVLGLSLDDVIQAVRGREPAPTGVEALAARPVQLESGEPIALAEIADVSIVRRPAAEHPHHDGQPALLLRVFPGTPQRAAAVAERVKAHIGWLKANGLVPGGVRLEKLFDEAIEARQWLRRVLRQVGVAIVLAVIATYLFLGLRPALSVLGAFAVWLPLCAAALWVAGMTLNMMTVAAIMFAGVVLVLATLRQATLPLLAALALATLASAWFWHDALGIYAQALSGFGVLVFVAVVVSWLVSGFAAIAGETSSPALRWLPRRWRTRGVLVMPLAVVLLAAATLHLRALPAVVGTPFAGGTLALRVYGTQEGQLPVLADGLRARLHALPEVFDVSDPLEPRLHWRLRLDETKLQAADIGIVEVARYFEIARNGLVVGELADAEARLPLRVRLAADAAGTAFQRLLLRGERKDHAALYLRDVGIAEQEQRRRERVRVQQQPALEIRARWRGAAVPRDIRDLPKTTELPAGYALQLDVTPTLAR